MTDQQVASLFPFVENGQFGLRRADGSHAVEPKYRRASRSTNGISTACDSLGQLVLVNVSDLSQHICAGFEGSPGGAFCHGRIAIRPMTEEQPMDRYVNAVGVQVIANEFAHGRNFDCCGATVKVGHSDKVVRRINFDGDFVGNAYLTIRPFHPAGKQCGATVAWLPQRMILVDGLGEQIGREVFAEVWQEHEGLTPVKVRDNRVGWVDTEGSLVETLPAQAIGNHFESGLVPVFSSNEKWGLMNRRLEWVIEPLWDVLESVGENRFLAGSRDHDENTRVRLIDGCGNLFGQHSFEWIGRFQEGVAQVYRLPLKNAEFQGVNEFNYIDMQGNLLFDDWV